MDRTVKVTSLQTNSVVLTTPLDFPAWSCAWHPSDPNLFYCGLVNGRVCEYDARFTGAPVSVLLGAPPKPVTSLRIISAPPFGVSGILAGLGSGVGFWSLPPQPAAEGGAAEPAGWSFTGFDALAGSCMSMGLDGTTGLALASFRGSTTDGRLHHTGA
jgi:hypothetical protein